jgi:hypothetical protein
MTSEYDDLVAVVRFVVVFVLAFILVTVVLVVVQVVVLGPAAPLGCHRSPSLPRLGLTGQRVTAPRPGPADHVDMPVPAAGQAHRSHLNQPAPPGQLPSGRH